jgi:hypothetical protein
VKQLEDRQHKGRGLARARLGAGKQVAAGEHDRDRLRLYRRRVGVALGGNRPKEVGGQPELIERGSRGGRLSGLWRCGRRGNRRDLAAQFGTLGHEAELI